MSKTYLTVSGQIRSEHRYGEAKSRDYVHDALGNVVAVFQDDWPVALASYDPYGEFLTNWNMSSYKFTWNGSHGYRQTGLEWSSTYVRARHYAFMDGGWTTRDPLWPNEMPYGYVEGMAMSAIDPSGMLMVTYDPSCDASMKAVLRPALSKIASLPGDVLDEFEDCLTGLQGNCARIGNYSGAPTLFSTYINNTDPKKNVLFVFCLKNCKAPEPNQKVCGNFRISKGKGIGICFPYPPECGPLECTILHEMIHSFVNIKHYEYTATYPDQDPWSCLDKIPGCLGHR